MNQSFLICALKKNKIEFVDEWKMDISNVSMLPGYLFGDKGHQTRILSRIRLYQSTGKFCLYIV